MIILLQGPDTFRSHRRFVQLREAFQAKHDPSGISTVVVDATETDLPAIRSAVTTQGFFSPKRFIGINRYSASSSIDAAGLTELLQAFTKSNDVIIVIREVPAEKNAGAKRGGRAKANVGPSFPDAKTEVFSALAPAEVHRWIASEVKQRGGTIAPAATKLLQEWCGEDMWRLSNEIDKLVLHAAEKTIQTGDVEELLHAPEVSNVFAVVDAVAQQRRSDALQLLHQELQAGTHPLALISLLANHLGILLNVQRMPKTSTGAVVAKQLGIHPFVAGKAVLQAKKFEPSLLADWHHRLVEADATIKSTSVDPEVLLEMIVARS